MALSKVENTVLEPEGADCAAYETRLGPTTSQQSVSYADLFGTSVGMALSAIQVWYEDFGDELRAEAVLAAREVT